MDSFIYFILWVSLQYYVILLLKCSSFGHWEAFQGALCPSDIPPSLCCPKHFLTFWHYKQLRAHLSYLLPLS